jgi:protein gp37
MGEISKIAWTDATFNPWIGCAKVSAGCANCYAEEMMDKRYGRVQWGVNGTRSRTSQANWHEPIRWNRKADGDGVRKRVFCSSLADVFEDRAELEPWRRDLFMLIQLTPYLDWLLLTKRPENAMRMLPDRWLYACSSVEQRVNRIPSNVWIGTSVENQEQAEKRIPHLLQIPATVRFLSMEPLLGPVNLRFDDVSVMPDWVIVGGESGSKARPMATEWARDICFQCKMTGTPFFMKQLGGYPDKREAPEEWPTELRVREFPLDTAHQS